MNEVNNLAGTSNFDRLLLKFRESIPFDISLLYQYAVFTLDDETRFFSDRDLALQYGEKIGYGKFLIRRINCWDCEVDIISIEI